MMTVTEYEIPSVMLSNYLNNLVNQFFKILPIRESEEPSLKEYMCSLQLELLGCSELIVELTNDSMK